MPHQRLPRPQAPGVSRHGVAGVGDVSAAAYIIGMQNIQAHNAPRLRLFRHAAAALVREKILRLARIQLLHLRKGRSLCHHFVPDGPHGRNVFFFVFPYNRIHIIFSIIVFSQ